MRKSLLKANRLTYLIFNKVQNQLLISRYIGYINKEEFGLLAEKTITESKFLNGLIKETKENIPNS